MPSSLLLGWCLLITQALVSTSAKILHTGPENGTLMKRGSYGLLSCSTDAPWSSCQWVLPSREKSCSVQRDGDTPPPPSTCEADNRILLRPGETACNIIILEVSPDSDSGDWTCVVDGPEGQDEAVVYLEVEQPPSNAEIVRITLTQQRKVINKKVTYDPLPDGGQLIFH